MFSNQVSIVPTEEKSQQEGTDMEGWEEINYMEEPDDELTSLFKESLSINIPPINILQDGIIELLDSISSKTVKLATFLQIKKSLEVHAEWRALWHPETGDRTLFYTERNDSSNLLVRQSDLSKEQVILLGLASKFNKTVDPLVYHKIICNDKLKREIYPIIDQVCEEVLSRNTSHELPLSTVSTVPVTTSAPLQSTYRGILFSQLPTTVLPTPSSTASSTKGIAVPAKK